MYFVLHYKLTHNSHGSYSIITSLWPRVLTGVSILTNPLINDTLISVRESLIKVLPPYNLGVFKGRMHQYIQINCISICYLSIDSCSLVKVAHKEFFSFVILTNNDLIIFKGRGYNLKLLPSYHLHVSL